jgi:hypothetical protein
MMLPEGHEMDVYTPDEAKSDPALASALASGNDVLGKQFSRVTHPPRAAWRLVRNEGPTSSIELQLTDADDSVSRQFAADEFADPQELRWKISSLWGDLIMLAFRNSSERMLTALREMRKEEERRESQLQTA